MVFHRRVVKVVPALLGLARLMLHLEMEPGVELAMHLVVVVTVIV